MFKSKLLASLMLAAALCACQTLPASPGAASPASAAASAPSTSDQIGKALQEVTIARQAFTTLAKAGKITWNRDDAAQASLTAIRNQLTTAQTLVPTNPAQAAQLLANALQALAVYQGVTP